MILPYHVLFVFTIPQFCFIFRESSNLEIITHFLISKTLKNLKIIILIHVEIEVQHNALYKKIDKVNNRLTA